MEARPKIVVLDGFTLNPGDIPWAPVGRLGELTVHDRTPPELVVRRAEGARIVLTNKTVLSAETIGKLASLELIGVLATGCNVVDLQAARKRGVAVCNVPAYSTDSVAEFTFALILEFFKRTHYHSELVKSGRWQSSEDFCFWDNPGFRELAGKTIGIVGFGTIGRRVGAIADAFKMRIIACSPSRSGKADYPFLWRSVEEIFSEADVVTLHCPLTDENRGMVGAGLLSRMKMTALLVNTARGPLVDEQALADALGGGVIAGAACDVVSAEPIGADNPLLKAKNILITPHIAWAACESRRRLMDVTAQNIAAFLAGRPQNIVN